MIRLKKGDEPLVLNRNGASWAKVVLDKIKNGEKPTDAEKGRYRHPDIKASLVAETHGKCAYCESKLKHVTYGDAEHIAPKSVNPDQWFSWGNLTLACDVCNTNKSSFAGNHDTFIDPYKVDPEQFFCILERQHFPNPDVMLRSLRKGC